MSGRLTWTDSEDFDVLPVRATDSFAAALDRLDSARALAGKEDEDERLPPDGDLDEDDELGDAEDDDLDDEDDDGLDDDEDEDLDDPLIDLDDEYDDTDADERPHPGHRYDE